MECRRWFHITEARVIDNLANNSTRKVEIHHSLKFIERVRVIVELVDDEVRAS